MAGNRESRRDTSSRTTVGQKKMHVPLRPAPPPPKPTQNRISKLNSQNSQSLNDISKENDNINSKTNMFYFLRKSSSNSDNSKPTTNKPSKSSSWGLSKPELKNNKKNDGSQSLSKVQPTIIRPASQPTRIFVKKKKAPPRPPPPKHKGCILPLDPPSYEEVLLADNQGSSSRQLGIPQLTHNKNYRAPKPITENSLIDFDSPSTFEQPFASAVSNHSSTLLELEDVFKNIDVTSVPDSNCLLTAGFPSQSFSSNTTTCSSRSSITSQFPFERTVSVKTTGEQLHCNSPYAFPNLLTNNHQSQVTCSELAPPPLPPRPKQFSDGDYEDPVTFESSCPSFSPPSLPPKPKNYIGNPNEATSALNVTSDFFEKSEPHGLALHDFESNQADELSFKTNDIITLISRINPEWLYGCRGEQEGMFPRNFVQVVVPLPDDPEFQDKDFLLGNGPRCVALHDFAGEGMDELPVSAGCLLNIVARVNDEWIYASLAGKYGFIPANIVRTIEDNSEVNTALTSSSETSSQLIHVALYDFEGINSDELTFKKGDKMKIIEEVNSEWLKGQIIGTKKVGLLPKNFVQIRDNGDTCETIATVMYDFEAAADQELTVKGGNTITIINKVDSDWVYAEMNGIYGLVPLNFLQIH